MKSLIFVLVMLLGALGGVAFAQDQERAADRFASLQGEVAEIEEALAAARSPAMVSEARLTLQESRVELAEFRRSLAASRAQLESDIGVLGPPPEVGEEPQALAQLRQSYAERLAEIDRLAVLANALSQRMAEIQESSAAQLRTAFVDSVFARSPPPFIPEMLGGARERFNERIAAISEFAVSFTEGERPLSELTPSVAALAVSFAVFLGLVFPARRYAGERLWGRIPASSITKAGRAAIAMTRATTRLVLGGLGVFVVTTVTLQSGLAPEAAHPAIGAAAIAATLFVLANALSRAIFSPNRPEWRLAPLSDGVAKAAHGMAFLLALIFFVDQVIVAIWGEGETLNAFLQLETLFASLVFGAALLFGRRRVSLAVSAADESQEGEEDKRRARWPLLRTLILLPAALMLGASVLGYAAFARWVFEKAAYFALFVGLGYLLRAFVLNWSLAATERLVSGRPQPDDAQDDIVSFWTRFSVNLLVAAAAAPFALAVLGLSWSEIQALVTGVLSGVSIGALRISPGSILWALVLVAAVLIGTRLFQRVMERRLLPMTRLNTGARHSFTALLGYLGLLVAFLTGVSAIGFDLSNLTIIAGALSVGIGFGLQSIVNNFVSGLILLFERPIKIGDWVVTASGEGMVRRINVRSTEIETFDRCAIIVPNSELITSSVLNWTHKDKIARVLVPVGVAYDTDPEFAREVLLRAAEGHSDILAYPKSYVYFADFGDSALNLELRVFIRDANNALWVRNDLRFRVYAELKKAGIEIPFPQRDVHLRTPRAAPALAGADED